MQNHDFLKNRKKHLYISRKCVKIYNWEDKETRFPTYTVKKIKNKFTEDTKNVSKSCY